MDDGDLCFACFGRGLWSGRMMDGCGGGRVGGRAGNEISMIEEIVVKL